MTRADYQIVLTGVNWDWDTLHYLDSFEMGLSETVDDGLSIWHGLKLDELTTAYKTLRRLYPGRTLSVERCTGNGIMEHCEEIFRKEKE